MRADLTNFLLARIAEDEAIWRNLGKNFAQRMPAECEAKRRIVQECGPSYGCFSMDTGDMPTVVLHALAAATWTTLIFAMSGSYDTHRSR